MSTTIEPQRRAAPLENKPVPPQAPTPGAPQDAEATDYASSARSKTWLLSVLGVLGVSALVAGGVKYAGGLGESSEQFVVHTAARTDLPIIVTERGTLESQENLKILCEVDDVRSDGIRGTPIIWLIPNGASVKKGDLLIEFASAGAIEELDEEILETEAARSEQIQARAKYDNQITQNETALANAELAVKLAELELEMYTDPEKGTHKLEVEEINRLVDDVNNEILAAQANLELKKNDKQGIQTLFKLGYAGKSEVDRSRLEFLQAESQFAAKLNKLKTQLATLEKKKSYELQMQKLQLQGSLETAIRQRDQVVRDNEAALEQAKAAKDAAEESLKKQQEQLERWKKQVENCKVYAPQEGMVVYAAKNGRRFWEEEIRIGAAVDTRQHVLSLPNLQHMQARLSIHESELNQVKEGLPATIRIEALPDRKYAGKVTSVAVLAEQQGTSSKVYDSIVTIDGEVEGLRPGMTAVVEIHVDHLRDVVAIPVQAIVQVERETWCYVQRDGVVERAPVELGATNDKFVEVKSGIEAGDQVILNPMSIVEQEKDDQQPLAPKIPTGGEAEGYDNLKKEEQSPSPSDSQSSDEGAAADSLEEVAAQDSSPQPDADQQSASPESTAAAEQPAGGE